MEYKTRVKLPDSLPELDFAPPEGRSRRRIVVAGVLGWAAATAIAWSLLSGQLNWGARPAPTSAAPRPALAPKATPSPAPEAPEGPAPLPAATHSTGSIESIPLLPSCESAMNDSKGGLEHSDWSLPRDMTGTDYNALLDGPVARKALKHCAKGKFMRIDLCVAVRGVRAVGVTVQTAPMSDAATECVNRAITEFRFPHQRSVQVFRSRVTL